MDKSWALSLRLREFNLAVLLHSSVLQTGNVSCEGFTLFSNVGLGKRSPKENCVAITNV